MAAIGESPYTNGSCAFPLREHIQRLLSENQSWQPHRFNAILFARLGGDFRPIYTNRQVTAW